MPSYKSGVAQGSYPARSSAGISAQKGDGSPAQGNQGGPDESKAVAIDAFCGGSGSDFEPGEAISRNSKFMYRMKRGQAFQPF